MPCASAGAKLLGQGAAVDFGQLGHFGAIVETVLYPNWPHPALATMASIAAAACGKAAGGINGEQRRGQRDAEEQDDRDGKRAAHLHFEAYAK